jgi:hypothetical protein
LEIYYYYIVIVIIIFFSTTSRLALDFTQPPMQGVKGTLSPWVKRPGREVEHSPPTSAEVKITWLYTSTLPYAYGTTALCWALTTFSVPLS